MNAPMSDEVRFHSIKSLFDTDATIDENDPANWIYECDPEISEKTADTIALIAEVLAASIVCVILAFLIYGVLG